MVSMPTLDDVLKVLDLPATLVHLVQPGHLDKPPHIVREQLVVDDPFRKLVPFLQVSAIDRQAPLDILVFALFQIGDDL